MIRKAPKWSEKLERQVEGVITSLGYSVGRPKELAKAVLELSDHFHSQKNEATPWSQRSSQAAYLSYFFPLGFSRVASVVEEALRLGFFEGLKSFIDFGAGPGTGSLALEAHFKEGHAIERSREAIHIHKKFATQSMRWSETFSRPSPHTLGVFSYVLNEMPEPPNFLWECEAVMIIEPSTRKDFVNFLALRTKLIEKGFTIWGPCTHQGQCPLENGRDWCHDRIEFEGPSWWQGLEAELPMKNRSITFSYLLGRKKKIEVPAGTLRIIGDRLDEKGKTRQLICRGSDREFFSWLHRAGEAPELARGQTVILEEVEQVRGNELRSPKLK